MSENEIFAVLEKRKHTLTTELQRIEEALLILKGEKSSRTLKAEKRAASKSKSMRPPVKSADIPDSYEKYHTWTQKILFILSKKQNVFKDDLIKEICRLEPEWQPDKVGNLVSVKLSSLLKDSIILAQKDGRKFRYSLATK